MYAPYQYLDISFVSGTFQAGETITGGTSLTSATVNKVGADALKILLQEDSFSVGETITGSISGATATVDAIENLHEAGGIRIREFSEGHIISSGGIIGGRFSMTTGATSNTFKQRPAYCRMTDVFFDSSLGGCIFDSSADFSFSGCWFSNRPSSGAVLSNTFEFSFEGCTFANCGNHGALVQSSCVGTTFKGCKFIANNTEDVGGSGLVFAGGTREFVVQGSVAKNGSGFPGIQLHGIRVLSGASDAYIIADNLVTGNSSSGVDDAGVGSFKRVADNY